MQGSYLWKTSPNYFNQYVYIVLDIFQYIVWHDFTKMSSYDQKELFLRI